VPTKGSHFTDVRAVIESLKPGYPVYCLRPAELDRSAKLFLDNFPGRVLYAIKCNPNPAVLQCLYDAGIRHFDTASLVEIATIREMFADADTYYMHPVKSRASILSAREIYHVDHWVIDHENELDKLIEVVGAGDGQVVLVRIRTKSFGAAFELSDKFGAPTQAAASLLDKVAEAGFQPGLAFHVGSQVRNVEAFRDAIVTVGQVLENANTHIHYLDVGGGFPVHYIDEDIPDFMEFMDAIKESLATINLRGDCVVMCEPGRALVGSGASLVTQVQLRKEETLYLNDGIYHSMSEQRGGFQMPVRAHRLEGEFSVETIDYTIFGPTCDSVDVLPYKLTLPADINEGDWVEFGQMGAYSNSMATAFNGFFTETYVTVDEAPLLPDAD
jgi:ornithine decarboxylase